MSSSTDHEDFKEAPTHPIGGRIFFPNLDGLRTIAFLLVFWSHYSTEGLYQKLTQLGYIDETHLRYFNTGGLGVSFFFVLSGFLITYLLLAERQDNGRVDLRAFYVRRVLRIFPLYYLVIILAFVVYPLARHLAHLSPVPNGDPLYYSFFLGNFDVIKEVAGIPSFVGVLWSVSIEEQFYIAWAVLITLLPTRLYKYLFVTVIIFSTVFRFANESDARVLYYHTFSVMSDLAVGGSMAYLAINYSAFTGWFRDLNRWVIACVYVLGVTIIWLVPNIFWLNDMLWLQRLVFSLIFAFIIAEQNWARRSPFKMSRSRILSRLGIYTYGLYCLHLIALNMLSQAYIRVGLDITTWAGIGVFISTGMGASVLLAWLSYQLYEKRFLSLKKYFTPSSGRRS